MMKKLFVSLFLAAALFAQDGNDENPDDAIEAMLLKFASESFLNEFEYMKAQVGENTKEIQNIKDIFYSDDFLAAKKDSKSLEDSLKKQIIEVKKEKAKLQGEVDTLKKSQDELLKKLSAIEQKLSETPKESKSESTTKKAEKKKKSGIVRDIDMSAFMGYYNSIQEQKKDPVLEKFKPTTYKLNKDAKTYDKPNGKELSTFKKGSVITSYQKMGSWYRVSGVIISGKWKKQEKEAWIQEGDIEVKK